MLDASSSSLADVVKVNIFLADMEDFGAMNEAYMEGFPEPRPVCHPFLRSWFGLDVKADYMSKARSCIGVKALPMGSDVEMECLAVVRLGVGKAKL